jgi:hypothetical protein
MVLTSISGRAAASNSTGSNHIKIIYAAYAFYLNSRFGKMCYAGAEKMGGGTYNKTNAKPLICAI